MGPSVTAVVAMHLKGHETVEPAAPSGIGLIEATATDSSLNKLPIVRWRDGNGPLSPPEVEVVTRLAQDKQVQDSATILGISSPTTTLYLSNVLRKLRIANRAELRHEANPPGMHFSSVPRAGFHLVSEVA